MLATFSQQKNCHGGWRLSAAKLIMPLDGSRAEVLSQILCSIVIKNV